MKTHNLQTCDFGFHDITAQVALDVRESGIREGLCTVYCPHTTAAITINENADPDVRYDMEKIMNHIVKENEPYYDHVLEGSDDMPAHEKSTLSGVSLTVPITNGRLNLGTWQGIYFYEYRNDAIIRKIDL